MLGDWRAAIADCTRALAAADTAARGSGPEGFPPEGSPAAKVRASWLLNRAVALRMLGALEPSIADCGAALALDSTDAAAYQNRALAHRRLGRWEAAAADLTAACALLPGDARALIARGSALGKLGDCFIVPVG